MELFVREHAKESFHMNPTLIIVVLTSHHKRTHRDVWGISLLDILRGQIKVRVPAQKLTSGKSYATAISGIDEPVVF